MKSTRIALKAIRLALMEFQRISYQKKADPKVIEALQKALEYFEKELSSCPQNLSKPHP